MNELSRFRFLTGVALVLVAFLVATGCQDSRFPFDMTEPDELAGDIGRDDTSFDADAGQGSLSLTVLDPVPGEAALIPGPVDFMYRYDDSEGAPATITISGAGSELVAMDVEGPGEYKITFVPVSGFQGSGTVRLDAATVDGRSTGIDVPVFIDMFPPVISFEPPTPDAYAEVQDDFVIRVKVTDSGTLVHRVRIAVMDFTWEWSSPDGEPAAEVDSSEHGDLVIPVSGWTSGLYTVEVTADDGMPGRTTTALLPFAVRRAGEFAADSAGVPKPAGAGIAGAGIRIGPSADGIWGMVTSRGVYIRSVDGIRKLSDGFKCEGVLWAVFDVNYDGFDDFVGYCGDGGSERIVYMLQDASGTFTELPVSSGALKLVDLAVGDLNGDAYADVAFLEQENTPLSLIKVVMSTTGEAGELTGWSPVTEYLGASSPTNVEIGLFSDNGRNAVLVTSEALGNFTVFPVDGNGSLMMGEDSFYVENPFGVTLAANFCSNGAAPDKVVTVIATNKCNTVYVAGMMNDGSARFLPYASRGVGREPTDIEVGDVDADGTGDILVLSKGANMVLFFRGGSDCSTFQFVDAGMALVSGAATDIWLSDWDNDGYLDLCALTESGVSVVYYRMDANGGHFDGSYQARVESLEGVPIDLVVGHFAKPKEGESRSYLDAAVLLSDGGANIFEQHKIIAQPIELLRQIEYPFYPVTVGFNGLVAVGMVSGNFGSVISENQTVISEAGLGTYVELDGLVVSTSRLTAELTDYSSAIAVFDEDLGYDRFSLALPIAAGSSPRLVAAGGFDLEGDSGTIDDVAFVWHRERTPEIEPAYFLQSFLGQGDATFQKLTPDGTQIEPLIIQENRFPGVIISYPLRRTLKDFLSGKAVSPDLIVANKGTSDFTVFLGLGDGRFLAKYDGSLDFAVGLPPVDVAAGYLKSPLDGSVSDSIAAGEFPDVVTLTREGNTSVLTVSYAMDSQELQERGLDVGFDVPSAIIFYQSGSGTPPNPVPVPVALALADVDMDGLTDILVLDQARSSVSILINQGNRQFSKPHEFFTGTEPISIVVADVNADGCPDILTADQKGATMSVLRNSRCAATIAKSLDRNRP